MSYCRFGDGSDVYLFFHVGGFFQCCACSLAEKVPTILTKGLEKDDPRYEFYKSIDLAGPCEECQGEGCGNCMMHGNTDMLTSQEALNHLKKHLEAGHLVPDDPFERLREEIETGYTREKEYSAQQVVEGLINLFGGDLGED